MYRSLLRALSPRRPSAKVWMAFFLLFLFLLWFSSLPLSLAVKVHHGDGVDVALGAGPVATGVVGGQVGLVRLCGGKGLGDGSGHGGGKGGGEHNVEHDDQPTKEMLDLFVQWLTDYDRIYSLTDYDSPGFQTFSAVFFNALN